MNALDAAAIRSALIAKRKTTLVSAIIELDHDKKELIAALKRAREWARCCSSAGIPEIDAALAKHGAA